ncbi:MAG: hypothetical protein ACLGJC_26595, partial [Alphaproteobacteria bacterium]
KVCYILNQVDTTAKEDNLEAVFGAWQRAIAQAGLVSGRFYAIYDQRSAVAIEDDGRRARYEARRDHDLAELHTRINEVEVARAYRIIGSIDSLTKELEGEVIPKLREAMAAWRRRVLIGDAVWGVLLAVLLGTVVQTMGGGFGALLGWMFDNPDGGVPLRLVGSVLLLGGLFLAGHFKIRQFFAGRVAAGLSERFGDVDLNLRQAFLANTRFFRSIFAKQPAGWGGRARKAIFAIREATAVHVQRINDLYTDPAGRRARDPASAPAPAAE